MGVQERKGEGGGGSSSLLVQWLCRLPVAMST